MSQDSESVLEASVAEARRELRRHLEWSEGVGTLAVLLARNPSVLRALRARTVGALRRRDRQVSVLKAGRASDTAIRRALTSDVVWIDLPFGDADTRLQVLRALNHLRTSLGRSHAAVILTGPVQVASEGATEAADLWSVATLVRRVASPMLPSMPLEPPERDREPLPEPQFGRIYVPPGDRDGSTLDVLAAVRRASRLSATDLAAAREEAAEAVSNADPQGAMVALGQLARAELAARAGDIAEASTAGWAALKAAQGEVGMDVRRALVDLAWSGGDVQVAIAAATHILTSARRRDDLPSRREVVTTLEDLGFLLLQFASGDQVGEAAAHMAQAADLRRAIAEETDEIADLDALAVNLETTGWIEAAYLGDSANAARSYDEAAAVRQRLRTREPTVLRQRDLARTLGLLADVTSSTDPESAVTSYSQAIELLQSAGAPVNENLGNAEIHRLQERLAHLQYELAG